MVQFNAKGRWRGELEWTAGRRTAGQSGWAELTVSPVSSMLNLEHCARVKPWDLGKRGVVTDGKIIG